MIFRYIVQKNEIMAFAATWIDPEFIIESDVRQRKTKMIRYHFFLEFFLSDTNKLIYKTEADSDWKTNVWVPKEKRREE